MESTKAVTDANGGEEAEHATGSIVGTWEYHIFGVLPTGDEVVLEADRTCRRSGWEYATGFGGTSTKDRIVWDQVGRWALDGDTVVLRMREVQMPNDRGSTITLRLAEGFLYRLNPPDDGRTSGRYLLKGRDFPMPPIVGKAVPEAELLGTYDFYAPINPDEPFVKGTQLTIKPQGQFSGVCLWSDGKGFFGPVTYEGRWQIKADRLVLDTTVWNAERQEPWPDHEEYIMTDGVLLLADFGAQREGTPYYKKR